jgi:hypothetical protein
MSSTRGAKDPKRDHRDFYRTPAWCVSELYKHHPGLPMPTLDPCAGDGALLRAAPSPRTIRGIELDPDLVRESADIEGPPVQLSHGNGLTAGYSGEHILMNPPYNDALRWVQKAVDEAASACVLLRLGFMGAQSRNAFWNAHPPRALVVLSTRPSFRPDPETGKMTTDSADYGWFFWSNSRKLSVQPGLATLSWITDPAR